MLQNQQLVLLIYRHVTPGFAMRKRISNLSIYFQPRILTMLMLGISSGLPLLLTGSTLTVWLTEVGVDKTTIGLFAMVGMPYSLKFIWAPLIDFVKLPILSDLLGRRKSWLILSQFLVVIAILILGFAKPEEQLKLCAILAIFTAFISATQDIVVDAYRIELLKPEEQGPGISSYITGYRVGMLVAGAQALFLAEYLDWSVVYFIMAIIIAVIMSISLFLPEPDVNVNIRKFSSSVLMRRKEKGLRVIFRRTIVQPFADFASKNGWLAMLILIMLFKLGNAFAGHMATPFYIELGFSKSEIATIVKTYGLVATISGALLGGAIMRAYGIARGLWITGIAQLLSILLYIVQEYYGYNTLALVFTISFEDLASGMGSAAIFTFVSGICSNPLYTATQYALISSITSLGRTFFSSGSGYVAEVYGWTNFFIFSTLLAIPALLVLFYLHFNNKIKA